MTVQWALLHPRGPQDDRAIAKRSCGTRDRSACAFQASCARSMSMRSAVFCRTLKVSLNSRSERRDRRWVGHHLRYELEKIEPEARRVTDAKLNRVRLIRHEALHQRLALFGDFL